MGRASSSKKVARAASTGGGRTARGARPLGWYAAIALVVTLGISGIVFSREERRDELAAGADGSAPVANVDHWHAAYGIYLCDGFAPAITNERDPKGIHTHADGIIHIHPFVRSAAGRNATLEVFADAVDMTLGDDELEVPGGESYESGETKCGDDEGIVQVKVNDEVITEEVANIKLNDQDVVTIAFAPRGADIPPPPSAGDLARLNPETEEIEPLPTETTTADADGEGEGAEGEGTTGTTTAPAEGDTSTTAAP
ncbi:MAG TPA: hypothetical protein VM933_07765 [Acidimicrobiales bacterium]|nr:hypothetical protein [Acidimicrobiales bacterium]